MQNYVQKVALCLTKRISKLNGQTMINKVNAIINRSMRTLFMQMALISPKTAFGFPRNLSKPDIVPFTPF